MRNEDHEQAGIVNIASENDINPQSAKDRLYRTASLLALITIGYNICEGAVSVWLGADDETLSLFGFGIDSLVEVISGVGIWHMVRSIRSGGGAAPDIFEQRALRITGYSFHGLAAGLVLTAGLSLYQRHYPKSTFWGIVVSLISISFMWLLIRAKVKTGRALKSQAILADAACSKACLYLSLALLTASAGYQLTGVGLFDAGGALAIAFFAYREGKESLQKAQGLRCCSGKCCG